MADIVDDFYLYLTSLGCGTMYPNNTMAQFTNAMAPTLQLEGAWYVGLVDVLFNSKIYTVTQNDPMYAIDVNIHGVDDDMSHIPNGISYRPSKAMLGDSVASVSEQVASDLRLFLIKHGMLHPSNGKIYSHVKSSGEGLFLPIKHNKGYEDALITMEHAPYAANLFGVERSCTYDMNKSYHCPNVGILSKATTAIHVYSDIVASSRFADTQTNILDIIPYGDTHTKGNRHIIYKKVHRNTMESITITMRNQRGAIVPFTSGAGGTTCLLHFKRG